LFTSETRHVDFWLPSTCDDGPWDASLLSGSPGTFEISLCIGAWAIEWLVGPWVMGVSLPEESFWACDVLSLEAPKELVRLDGYP
jgi:hypothetical protein